MIHTSQTIQVHLYLKYKKCIERKTGELPKLVPVVTSGEGPQKLFLYVFVSLSLLYHQNFAEFFS